MPSIQPSYPNLSTGPWPAKFVGAHLLLTEPIPDDIRYDAVDVLFLSPFYVNADEYTFQLGNGSNLDEIFTSVVQAARSVNPSIVIIVVQFYGGPSTNFELFNGDQSKIQIYADSVASFIENSYNQTLPNLKGDGQISARIQGYDVDVEGDTCNENLPSVLTAVRQSLDNLSSKLGSAKFSVSITPAWTSYLDATVAVSCDYINMQNYSGGTDTFPSDYEAAMPGLKPQQLVWGFCSEEPINSTESCIDFSGVVAKAQEIVDEQTVGAYCWRLNSDDSGFENEFQVWLYGFVHGVTLQNAAPESTVQRGWATNGNRTST